MSELFETTFHVGTVVAAEEFPETRKPEMTKLRIVLGDETIQSAAQTGYNYDPDELVGRQVLCAANLGTVNIAGYESQALTVGVPDEDGHPMLVGPDEAVPNGGELY